MSSLSRSALDAACLSISPFINEPRVGSGSPWYRVSSDKFVEVSVLVVQDIAVAFAVVLVVALVVVGWLALNVVVFVTFRIDESTIAH